MAFIANELYNIVKYYSTKFNLTSIYTMNVLAQFVKSRKDLKAKSPEGYKYEIKIKLKDIIEEFVKLPKISNTITTKETLYFIKGSNVVTVNEINLQYFIREKNNFKNDSKVQCRDCLSLK